MEPVPFGTTIETDIVYRDKDGDLFDPSDVIVKTQAPDGTEVSYVYGDDDEITRVSAGMYLHKFLPSTWGDWIIRGKGVSGDSEVAQEKRFEVEMSEFAAP